MRFWLLHIGLLLSLSIWAQPEIRTNLTPPSDQLLIGDRLEYSYQVQFDSNDLVLAPDLQQMLQHSMVEVYDHHIDTILDGAKKRFEGRAAFMAFDSGIYALKPMPVLYFDAQQQEFDTAFANEAYEFFVHTVAIDTTQGFQDIKGNMEPGFYLDMGLLTWFIIISLLGMAFIMWKEMRTKKEKEVYVPPVVQAPAHERALAALQALFEQKLWQQGEVKTYYVALTDILRGYFEERFEVSAMESTSDELLDAMSSHLSGEQLSELKVLLRTADMAKFAKTQPLPDDNQRCAAIGEQLISETIPSINDEPSPADPGE